MSDEQPTFIAINHDDYHATHVGRTHDNKQFFLTTPFVPAINGSAGRQFVAIYLFDLAGRLVDAEVDDLGTRLKSTYDDIEVIYAQRLQEISLFRFQRIEVRPFQVERFGIKFGLIGRPPSSKIKGWQFTVKPGDYMAFRAPWGSGEYDT